VTSKIFVDTFKIKTIETVSKSTLPDEVIISKIYLIRGQKVILDMELKPQLKRAVRMFDSLVIYV
jgi:hypothetical protein